MSVFEELFNLVILEVIVPDTSVQFPDQSVVDKWFSIMNGNKVDRKQAFFGLSLALTLAGASTNSIPLDEQLQSLLLIHIPTHHPTPL
jgi:hypothetical protein